MTSDYLLIAILIIVAVEFILERTLDYLNIKNQSRILPSELKDIYDEDKYLKSLSYQAAQTSFSFITSGFSFFLTIAMLSFGGFGYLDIWLRTFIDNEILLALAFFGLIFIASDLLTLPFQLYDTFVIEEKFGFNKTTITTFFADKIKGYLLAALFGAPILWLLIFLIQTLGENFWIYFWIVISIVILGINMFYTSLILPLFNKLVPLEDGSLKQAIQKYAATVSFPLDNIYVIDGSKRSNKANAFFSGIGKKKKIVLYDTLIQNHTEDELVAVLAHEVGHFKKKHIITSLVLSVLQIGLMLFIMSFIILNENLSIALGANETGIHLNLIAFTILYAPISKISGLVMNTISRKNEFEADEYATTTFGGSPLIEALKKLSVNNLSNLTPHKAYVFFHYSHPPLLQRLRAIEKIN
ncbi:MAG TPA: M48 family metallopeptidase [Cytophagales bacterium]|nr:M48 family metallopeptidase [Cytophagales bacterium]